MPGKCILLYGLFAISATGSFSQNDKAIQKAWIKTSIENLASRQSEADSLYTRYTFTRSALYISFYPAWDDFRQPWSISDNDLTIGFDTYKIEELTDTSLTFALSGFRRLKFLSEDYLASQDKYLFAIGDFEGKPLYTANKYITPRYSKKSSLRTAIQKDLERFNIKKASYFLATFIVDEEGKLKNIQVVNGISDGFDQEVVNQLLKTSKDWRPAHFKGKAVQSQLSYDIKYLDSLTPFNSRKLN